MKKLRPTGGQSISSKILAAQPAAGGLVKPPWGLLQNGHYCCYVENVLLACLPFTSLDVKIFETCSLVSLPSPLTSASRNTSSSFRCRSASRRFLARCIILEAGRWGTGRDGSRSRALQKQSCSHNRPPFRDEVGRRVTTECIACNALLAALPFLPLSHSAAGRTNGRTARRLPW